MQNSFNSVVTIGAFRVKRQNDNHTKLLLLLCTALPIVNTHTALTCNGKHNITKILSTRWEAIWFLTYCNVTTTALKKGSLYSGDRTYEKLVFYVNKMFRCINERQIGGQYTAFIPLSTTIK